MTTTEYKHVICSNYCKSHGNKGICAHCTLNPTLNDNFELSETAKSLIKIGILHCGTRLINDFVEEFIDELCKDFDTKVGNDG